MSIYLKPSSDREELTPEQRETIKQVEVLLNKWRKEIASLDYTPTVILSASATIIAYVAVLSGADEENLFGQLERSIKSTMEDIRKSIAEQSNN